METFTKLNDKFGIIIDNNNSINIKLSENLNNIFSSYLENNNFIYPIDVIYNYIYHNIESKQIITQYIELSINNYLNKLKRQFLSLFKKNKLSLDNILNIIDDFKIKLNKLNMFILDEKSLFKKSNINLCKILEQYYMEYILVKHINNNDIIKKYFNRIQYLTKYKDDFYNKSIIIFSKALNIDIISSFSKNYSFICSNIISEYNFSRDIYKLNYYFEKIYEYKSKYYLVKNISISKLLNSNILDLIKILFQYNDIEFRNIFFKKYEKQFLDIISFSNEFELDFLFLFDSNLYNITSANIIVLLKYFSNLYNLTSNTCNSNFKYIIINYFEKLINTQLILNNITQICKYINNNILDGNYNLNYLIIKIISNKIKFYDEIFAILENDLIRRLMFHNSNLEVENNFLKILQNNFLHTFLYKYKKIIENFYNSKDQYDNILILNKDVWNLNYEDGCHIVESFKNILFDNVKINNINFNTHNLVYFLHLGYVDIIFYSKETNLNIRMLPIHLYILQLLEKNISFCTNINIDIIHKNLPNYSLEFLSTIMESFIKIKLLELKNNNYVINLNYNKDNNNLIEVFNELYNIELKEENQIKTRIANNKSDILYTIINHLIKLNILTTEELYDKCYNYKKPFELTKDLFDNCIENMIKKDYIYIKENIIIKSL